VINPYYHGITGLYRPEIDGLRAIAVLSVILYHYSLVGFSGGFVGVDIFFVISGYLITSIIVRECKEGQFTLLNFYERRARRLLPALFTVLTVTLALGLIIYPPVSLTSLAKSTIATIFFAANIYFQRQTGYFEPQAENNPLLHMWSLGVEEQFYLVYPLLIIAALRWLPKSLRRLSVIGLLLSFALCLLLTTKMQVFAFYSLPTRGWELLFGALAALSVIRPARNRRINEFLAWSGLVAITSAVFLLTAEMPFPGYRAALPVVGTVIVLVCAPGTIVKKFLSWRPLVLIGTISYSLYLWHWPIFVFSKFLAAGQLTAPLRFILVLLAILLATLSWKFIEEPFRKRANVSSQWVWALALAGALTITGVASIIIVGGGLPNRFETAALELADQEHAFSPYRAKCHYGNGALLSDRSPCEISQGYAALAVWGDSHGVELSYSLAQRSKTYSVIELTKSACPPALDFNTHNRPHCARFNRQVLTFLESHPTIEFVVLTTRFDHNSYHDRNLLLAGVVASVKALEAAGKAVLVLGPLPNPGLSVPEIAATALHLGNKMPTISKRHHNHITSWSRTYLKRNLHTRNYLDPESFFCNDVSCSEVRTDPQGRLRTLYFDDNHPSIFGASLIADEILRRFGLEVKN